MLWLNGRFGTSDITPLEGPGGGGAAGIATSPRHDLDSVLIPLGTMKL
jgi:hypothetical protein